MSAPSKSRKLNESPGAHSDNYGTSEYWFIDQNESEDKDCFLTSH